MFRTLLHTIAREVQRRLDLLVRTPVELSSSMGLTYLTPNREELSFSSLQTPCKIWAGKGYHWECRPAQTTRGITPRTATHPLDEVQGLDTSSQAPLKTTNYRLGPGFQQLITSAPLESTSTSQDRLERVYYESVGRKQVVKLSAGYTFRSIQNLFRIKDGEAERNAR